MTTEKPTAENIETQEDRVLSDLKHDHYEEIKGLEHAAYVAELEYDEAKAISDQKKKTLARRETELRSCIRRGPDMQGKLPFRDDWRTVAIDEAINITEKQLEKLNECGVTNVGEFETLRAGQMSDYPRGLLSVKGFGESFVDAVENDIIEWLSANQQPADDDEAETDSDAA